MRKKNFILSFIIPVAVIIIAYIYKKLLGALVFAVYMICLCYKRRSDIYAARGNALNAKGDRKGALDWFKKACQCGGCRTNTRISYAYLLLKEGRVEESESILTGLAALKDLTEQERISVKSNIALLLWRKGDLDGAIRLEREVYDVYKNSTVYGTLGYFLIQKGDLESALKFNLEAYDFNSTDKIILDNLGQNYYLIGNIDKAEEIYGELFKLEPRFPECYYTYGKVLLARGDKEGAVHSMRKALTHSFSFLSTATREEIEKTIKEIEDDVERDDEERE